MGDCGAFSYIRDDVPPYTPDDVIDFYDECGFDLGISIDHVIFGYDPAADYDPAHAQVGTWRPDRNLPSNSPNSFSTGAGAVRVRFQPMGVAQGWSPASYASCGPRPAEDRVHPDCDRRHGAPQNPRYPRVS